MSPNTNSTISWDPSCLRLKQGRATRSLGNVHRGRRVSPVLGRFISGPISVSWMCQASRLGVGALFLGTLLWYLSGLRRADSFVVSNLTAQEWGIKPDAKRRALLKLEKAGLIRVERRGKRSPKVTLVVKKKGSEEFINSFPAG